MNTDLYSFPYVLVSGGAAGLTLSGCYWLVDIRKIGAPVWKPFMYFGMNAIAMYLLAEGAQIQHVSSSVHTRKLAASFVHNRSINKPSYHPASRVCEGDVVDTVLSFFYIKGNVDYNLQELLWPTGKYSCLQQPPTDEQDHASRRVTRVTHLYTCVKVHSGATKTLRTIRMGCLRRHRMTSTCLYGFFFTSPPTWQSLSSSSITAYSSSYDSGLTS